MAVEPQKPKRRRLVDPTLEAVAPEELVEGPPAAERWIVTEIRRLQHHEQAADNHRRKAMAGVAERFHTRLQRYCVAKLGPYRDEADDVVQDVFQDFEKLLGRVENEQHLRNLIFRLAKNKCADVVNRQRRITLTEEVRPLEEAPEPPRIDPEQLRRAIRELPKLEDRILLTLSLDHRMPIKQIAAVLEITEGAAKMRRHRARQRLRDILDFELDD